LCAANPGTVAIALGHRGARGPQQRTIDRLGRKYGPDVLMKVLDGLTAPQQQAAE
jgi:hypothetical protein